MPSEGQGVSYIDGLLSPLRLYLSIRYKYNFIDMNGKDPNHEEADQSKPHHRAANGSHSLQGEPQELPLSPALGLAAPEGLTEEPTHSR